MTVMSAYRIAGPEELQAIIMGASRRDQELVGKLIRDNDIFIHLRMMPSDPFIIRGGGGGRHGEMMGGGGRHRGMGGEGHHGDMGGGGRHGEMGGGPRHDRSGGRPRHDRSGGRPRQGRMHPGFHEDPRSSGGARFGTIDWSSLDDDCPYSREVGRH